MYSTAQRSRASEAGTLSQAAERRREQRRGSQGARHIVGTLQWTSDRLTVCYRARDPTHEAKDLDAGDALSTGAAIVRADDPHAIP